MSGIEIDMGEVRQFAADLGKVSGKAIPVARQVLSKGALNIKNQMRTEATSSGVPEAASLAAFISYDMHGLAAEIGPTEGAAGSFAFLYYGNSKNGPLLPDPALAMQKEADSLEKYLAKALGDLL